MLLGHSLVGNASLHHLRVISLANVIPMTLFVSSRLLLLILLSKVLTCVPNWRTSYPSGGHFFMSIYQRVRFGSRAIYSGDSHLYLLPSLFSIKIFIEFAYLHIKSIFLQAISTKKIRIYHFVFAYFSKVNVFTLQRIHFRRCPPDGYDVPKSR